MRVLKFGGTSVGSAANIEKVVKIVAGVVETDDAVIVLSAMSKVTDGLIDVAKTAEKGDESFRTKIRDLEKKHLETAEELLGDASFGGIADFVENRFNELRSICEGVFLLRELSPRTLDRVVSFGELLSTKIASARFTQAGVDNVWKDSRHLIRTDSAYTSAHVDFVTTNAQIEAFVLNQTRNAKEGTHSLAVLPGFIASDVNGVTTTLGRGGSDYTGAIVASALEADVLEIWTDVSGMMTADPRIVRNIREIPRITYREAMELSHFGAKVIYPPTIQPVLQKNIPIYVKNTFAPEHPGTLIEAVVESVGAGDIIRGITSIDRISVLSLEGAGMIGVPGFSKRLFDALSRAAINVILITQSSSEHSICVAIDEKSGPLAKDVVDREFEYEIAVGKIEPLTVENGLSILALVGDNMKSHTGISGKMFSALGAQGVNVRAIAQGSSERNISAIIDSRDVRKAVNSLHEEFFSDGKRQINLYVVGVGTVGSRLLGQLAQQHDLISDSMNLNLRVVAAANSKKIAFDEEGIDIPNYKAQLENSTIASDLDRLADLIIENNLRNSIFVDVTANPDVVRIYPKLLEKSISVVACNKVAASSEFEKYKRLKDLALEYNCNFLFETNVGAGLPIIGTLGDLTRSGDRVNRIEAVLSGTLNFVFNNYDGTRPFAEVVRQAQDEGYTEPDPRLDLSGTDVARKILILARESGHKLEMSDIENIGFLPESCVKGSVDDFYRELAANEPHFRRMLDEAKSNGLQLKYIASFADGRAQVGLQSIDADHNFAKLSGKDNSVLFYTNRYADLPLVVKGAGAGADVTAAGVFADIIRATKI